MLVNGYNINQLDFVPIKVTPLYDPKYNMYNCQICQKPAQFINKTLYDAKWNYLGKTNKQCGTLCMECYLKASEKEEK